MLNIIKLFEDYGVPKGVIHVSPQFMRIRESYLHFNLLNTIWIESNPFFYDYCSRIISKNEYLFNVVLAESNLNITVSKNETTSFIEVKSYKSLEDLLQLEKIESNNYDFLHLGIQKDGTVDFYGIDVEKFKYISIETLITSDKSILGSEKNIHNYLTSKRFKRVDRQNLENIAFVYYVKKRKYNKK